MAAVQMIGSEAFQDSDPRPYLRLVSSDPRIRPLRVGRPLAQRRAARERMMQRRRRTLVSLALVAGLVVLAWPGHAFGGVTGSGLPTDLANSSMLASGTMYVVQPGDTVRSIAELVNPVTPLVAQSALRRELGSSVVVPGEHVLIP